MTELEEFYKNLYNKTPQIMHWEDLTREQKQKLKDSSAFAIWLLDREMKKFAVALEDFKIEFSKVIEYILNSFKKLKQSENERREAMKK